MNIETKSREATGCGTGKFEVFSTDPQMKDVGPSFGYCGYLSTINQAGVESPVFRISKIGLFNK